MSFHFRDQPFWGLLVVFREHEKAAVERSVPHRFRPRLVARWVADADGRLERRWHHDQIGPQPTQIDLP